MTFINNLLGEGPLATIVAVALGLLVLVIVLVVIYRLSVGQGLRQAPGTRSRQPRLGIVDAFDLDRQRQLVLVRRDNVEHLIMIGGPNDLLIEPAIIRGQPAQSAEPRREAGTPGNGQNGDRLPPRLPSFEGSRDPDMEEPNARSTSFEAPPPREAPSREFQPQMREPAREPMRETSFAPPPVMAAPPPPPQATVARPPMPPIPNPEGQGAGPSLRPMPPPVRPAPPPPPPRAPAPPPLRPAPPPRQAPPPPAEPQPAPPPPVSPPPRQLSAEPPPPRPTVNIDSLEEEMAKLLGRPVDPPNRS